MKEYLVTNALGKFYYTKTETTPPNMFCEIPDGAECLLRLTAVNEYRFTKLVDSDIYFFNPHGRKEWYKSATYEDITGTKSTHVLWKRHTQPEVLPFIDDSNVDTATGHELDKIANDNGFRNRYKVSGLNKLEDDEHYRLALKYYLSINPADKVDEYLISSEHSQQFAFFDKSMKFVNKSEQADDIVKYLAESMTAVDIPESWLKDDAVNHPTHYTNHPSGIECIEITRHHDFTIGNAIKYLWRAGLKDSDNEIQDLKKAIWYIQDKINQLEKSNGGDN